MVIPCKIDIINLCMVIQPETIRPIIGIVGAQIFAELSSTSWMDPLSGAIRELRAAVGSHPGPTRKRNEDRAVVARVTSPGNDCFTVAILCDGVGGSEMGDTAAALAIAAFIGELARDCDQLALNCRVVQLIRRTDDVVRMVCRGRGATTLSVVVASRTGELAAANIGDSRIFSWTVGGGEFRQISVDDTLENEIRDLKGIDPSALQAKGIGGSLSQAIGEEGRGAKDLQIKTYGQEQLGMGAILASDGAWKGCEEGFKSIAKYAGSANDAVRRLLAFASWIATPDNISIIAIENLAALEHDERTESVGSAESLVSLWIGDSRVTICGIAPSETINSYRQDVIKPKNQRSRQSKRAANKSHKDKGQMDFMDANGDLTVRPNIEISTDDAEK